MITKLAMASAIGTARIPTHGSCLPVTSISTSLPSVSMLLPFDFMLEVGLIIKSMLMASPFEIPPSIPPALFEEKPSALISSLTSEPFKFKISSVFPIDTDLTALMLIIALAKSASNLSKTGAPSPTGQFSIDTPNLAPTELPSTIKSANILSKSPNLDISAKKYLLVFASLGLMFSAFMVPI